MTAPLPPAYDPAAGFARGRTLVMGVLNVTPDSFSDGGLFAEHARAVEHGQAMALEGADIVDVGGESTRPGSSPVDAEEEARRVVPVVRALASGLGVPVSIDTYKASTARLAMAAGAAIVNDVWGLQRDPAMADAVAETGAGLVVMHNRASADASVDILDEVVSFLQRSLELAQAAGVPAHRIAVDPGIGFGKTLEQNVLLVARLGDIARRLGRPVLLGCSRKSMIDKIVPTPQGRRLPGTLALHTAGILAGAAIIRVHDVAEAVQAARIADRLRGVWPGEGAPETGSPVRETRAA
jgi:dihydropteroate synthase